MYSPEVQKFLAYVLQGLDIHTVGSSINTPDGHISVTQECVDAITAIKAKVAESFTVEPAPEPTV
jgi:hypothetical protein